MPQGTPETPIKDLHVKSQSSIGSLAYYLILKGGDAAVLTENNDLPVTRLVKV